MKELSGAGLIATSARTISGAALLRPNSLADISELLGCNDIQPTFLAGGTHLCAEINAGADITHIVDLSRMPGLHGIDHVGDELRIGACVTHATGSAHPLVQEHFPGLARAWREIANYRVRYAATIGGNLMARFTRYEMPIILGALDAGVDLVTRTGPVRKPVASLWDASEEPAFLSQIAIPISKRTAFRYDRSLRPVMTLAACVNSRPESSDELRVAIATEYLTPHVLETSLDVPGKRSAAALAEELMSRLPDSFGDHVASNWYLRRSGVALIERILLDMTDA